MFFRQFLKTPKHSVFNYTPRYYDERKERMEKREKEYQAKEGDAEGFVSGIERGAFNKNRTKLNIKGDHRSSNMRLILILTALFGIAYFILFNGQ